MNEAAHVLEIVDMSDGNVAWRRNPHFDPEYDLCRER